MLISLKNIIFIFIVPFIYSYISFPLFINDRNLSSLDSPKKFIEKLKTSDIYIEVSIGSEKTKVKCYLDIYITEIMIGGEGIKNNKYNESNSESYNCTYCKIKEYYSGWYSEGIISTEDFQLLERIYGEKGIRNKIIHPYSYNDVTRISVDYEQLKKLLYNLLTRLKQIYEYQSKTMFKRIKLVK